METVTEGLVWYVVFVFSISLHESAHALAAFKLGDPTGYQSGQVTLDPLPHMRREPFGMVVVPIASFALGGWMIGWASVPYDVRWSLRYPKRAALMALAGPAANLALVVVAALFIQAGLSTGFFEAPETITFSQVTMASERGLLGGFSAIVSILLSLNLLLFLFNLLPVPPLDGSGAVPLLLADHRAQQYLEFISNPTFSLIGLLVAWNIFDVVFSPFWLWCVNLLYPGLNYG